MKTTKLQTQLVSTTTVLGSFLDTFQKLADSATSTKGKKPSCVQLTGRKIKIINVFIITLIFEEHIEKKENVFNC